MAAAESARDEAREGARDGAPPARPGPGARLPQRLRHRRDFLSAARARRWVAPGLILQARARGPAEAEPGAAATGRGAGPAASDPPVRVGFTCSKKIGNAVIRNRAKRRLREAARTVLPAAARPGWDYVLIGRPGATVARPFAALIEDLETALARVHRPPHPQQRAERRA